MLSRRKARAAALVLQRDYVLHIDEASCLLIFFGRFELGDQFGVVILWNDSEIDDLPPYTAAQR